MATRPPPDYPRRPESYAIKYTKWLRDSGVAIQAGPEVIALLVAVVWMEDDFYCTRPVDFYNEQLCRASGIATVPRLIRVRKRAESLGLLYYQEGAKRRPGIYFTTGMVEDSVTKCNRKRNYPLQKAQLSVTESVTKAQPSIPIPNPIPEPIPIPKKESPPLNDWEIPDNLDTPEVRKRLDDFAQMRKSIKKPIGDRKRFCIALKHFESVEHLTYALEHCISNEYQGLKPDYRPPSATRSPSTTFAKQRELNTRQAGEDFVHG